jgi:hypothetical protein
MLRRLSFIAAEKDCHEQSWSSILYHISDNRVFFCDFLNGETSFGALSPDAKHGK